MRTIAREESLHVLDLGPTSATNISLFAERGYRVHTEDLLTASADPEFWNPGENGTKELDATRFLKENLVHPPQSFDAVFFWDIADYLPEPLVKPVIERICTVMKPKGLLLAFFHTKDAGAEAFYSRYHIAGQDKLELQPIPNRAAEKPEDRYYKLQRVFNNRHIENLFREYSSLKFFLARDNLREVLVVR